MSRIPFNHNPHISHIYTHKNGYNLWVGDIEAANDLSLLSRLQIGAVLTVADKADVRLEGVNKIQHSVIKAQDMPSYQIRKNFAEGNKFIFQNLYKKRNVLVHCIQGVSRSITIVIAYLIRKVGFDFKTALLHVQNRRPSANPNYGFSQQLKAYQNQVQRKKGLTELKKQSQMQLQTQPNQQHNEVSMLIQQHRARWKQKLSMAFQNNSFNLSPSKKSQDSEIGRSQWASIDSKQSQKKLRYRSIQSRISQKSSSLLLNQVRDKTKKFNRNQIQLQNGLLKQDIKSIQSIREGIKNKSLSKARQRYKDKFFRSQNEKPENKKKRIDTQNNILFPRIILIKKLEKISHKN